MDRLNQLIGLVAILVILIITVSSLGKCKTEFESSMEKPEQSANRLNRLR